MTDEQILRNKICDRLIEEHETLGLASRNLDSLAYEATGWLFTNRKLEEMFAFETVCYRGYSFRYCYPRADLRAKLSIYPQQEKG